MPYLYTAARQAYETGLPLVRGLYLDHPDSEACYRFDEYLFGDSLLVAPLLTPANHRTVTLPEGTWYEFETGRLLRGGRDINVFAALDQVPVYVKAGAILPRQAENVPPAQAFVSDLLLDVYPGADGDAALYEDDSRTRAYQQDGFSLTHFSVREPDGTVRLTGAPTEGKRFGEARRIQIRVTAGASPAKVTCNGVELSTEKISFETTSQRVTIDLETFPVSQGWEVILTK